MARDGDLDCAALGNAAIGCDLTLMVKILRIIVKKQESGSAGSGLGSFVMQYKTKTYVNHTPLRVWGPLFRREWFGYP